MEVSLFGFLSYVCDADQQFAEQPVWLADLFLSGHCGGRGLCGDLSALIFSQQKTVRLHGRRQHSVRGGLYLLSVQFFRAVELGGEDPDFYGDRYSVTPVRDLLSDHRLAIRTAASGKYGTLTPDPAQVQAEEGSVYPYGQPYSQRVPSYGADSTVSQSPQSSDDQGAGQILQAEEEAGANIGGGARSSGEGKNEED